ncbi:DsbA family protein [Luethyella okanaganae]|uniref:DsbA family protein n=1 Tax=Luethyella okanaganae TaxID=69372 RepID=A0ABW1VFY7_9MICO
MNQAPSRVSTLETKYRRSKIINVVLAAVVVFLAVVLVAQMTAGTSPSAVPAPSETSDQMLQTSIERRDPNDPKAIGDVDAPVVMVEWTDMLCPYCAVFSRETLPNIVEEYVKTGKVRIEVRDVAFFGAESENAAVAARAAGNQGMFARYLSAVYGAAPESGHTELSREELIGFAQQIGVPDIHRFTADLDDPELMAQVRESTTTAQRLGVNSVPFFVAGGTTLSGAQPIEVFRDFLDAAIGKAQ